MELRQLRYFVALAECLSDAGETFLGYASRALREVDHGLSDLTRAADELSGEVRVGATGA